MKATVTYNAPMGDADSCVMDGVTFTDGKPVEIYSDEHPHLFSKLSSNHIFDVEMSDDDGGEERRKVGRPTKEEKAARDEAKRKFREAKEAKDKADRDLKEQQAVIDEGMAKGTFGKAPAADPHTLPKADVKQGMANATGHDFEKDRQQNIADRQAKIGNEKDAQKDVSDRPGAQTTTKPLPEVQTRQPDPSTPDPLPKP